MDDITTMSTPYAGLAAGVAELRASTAPVWAEQGTGLSFAGRTAAAGAARTAAPAAQVAVAGVRHTDLPGPVPRGAVV